MQRVKRSTAVAVLPAAPAGGTPGYFASPNPGGGVAATVPGFEWFNGVQEALMAVIEGQGLSGSDNDHTILRRAITMMIQAGQRAVVINNATFAGAVTGTGKAVYWDSANSRFDLAVADGTAKQNCVGFADVPNGNVYAFGDAVLFAGLTPGGRYYLDAATAGAITLTPPTNVVFIGVAKSATEVFVDVDTMGTKATTVQAQAGTDDTTWMTPLKVAQAIAALVSTVPPGAVVSFAMASAPTGWLKANGAAVSRTAYAGLFAAIGTIGGVGDGVTTFNLPDLRGEFIRGWDDSRGVDPGRALGTAQADDFKAHTHPIGANFISAGAGGGPLAGSTTSVYSGSTGGSETRPRNIALLACIKY